ncbi:MAG: DNA cytosine methyltransferase [Lachnospiraceae bacterium]|nr:DNA cytosine methyltransferase [Lachnospiraceae bacterium]
MYSVIDLFAGAGGLSLGFRQTRKYSIKVAFENNPAMQATYKKNHPRVDVRGDVCSADYSEIQKTYGPIDVVIGGPPCQGFSNANRQRNHAINHNNSLVKEYIRAILEIKPKAFVMENVSMLRSDVHRFYLSEKDRDLVESGVLETKCTPIPLLDKEYLFEGVVDLIKDEQAIKEYLWPELDYLELNVIYKATQNSKKLLAALNKHEKRLKAIAAEHVKVKKTAAIKKADMKAFSAILSYYNHEVSSSELLPLIEPAIMYQRMLNHALEILRNALVVNNYSLKDGLSAEIKSFAVFDYLMALLGTGDGVDGYAIAADVLSAADFGVPQKRMRFVIVGIRKDIAEKAKLPQGKFKGGPYRTVHDAISDLEDVEPVFETADDTGIRLEKKVKLSDLAKKLRDAKVLKNHLITKTTDVAMERFKALNQGENFHALDDSLKTNTYTDISRTQNTIYLRLDYQQPSGTVVNVRKSMWVHPVKDRAVSVREAARLQTFPDSFVFVGTKDKQYQQVGNAVPPIMAKAIATKLASQLEG